MSLENVLHLSVLEKASIGLNGGSTTICNITHSKACTHIHDDAIRQTKVKETNRHTVALWVAACGLEDSEDIHFQKFLCFSSSTLTFVKALVCLSHSWGCQITPLVILLTHTDTISACIPPSGGSLCGTKLYQDHIFLLPSFVLSALQTFIFLGLGLVLCSLTPKTHKYHAHKVRGRLPIPEI